jgi:nucleotide-binding universal stress UspA family protein
MMPFQKILFPVDFSQAVIDLAPAVTVLNAFNLVRNYSLAPSADDLWDAEFVPIPYSAALQKLRDLRVRRLEEFARTHFSNTSPSTLVEDGDPAMVIEWAAHHENADLVMMPTKGLGRFRRLLLGSVTAKVLHDVACPVLTSAHEPDPGSLAPAGCRSVLCAVNMDSETADVFRAAAFLAKSFGARVCLLHIEPSAGQSGQPSDPQEIRDAFERAVGPGGAAIGAKARVRIMDAAIPEGIRRIATEEEADLVVVGRGHARETFSQAWSHLYAIIRESPCPVLSV